MLRKKVFLADQDIGTLLKPALHNLWTATHISEKPGPPSEAVPKLDRSDSGSDHTLSEVQNPVNEARNNQSWCSVCFCRLR